MKKLIALFLMLMMAMSLAMPGLAEDNIVIVATTYPLYDLAKVIGGEHVTVKYAPDNAQEEAASAQILLCVGGEDDAWVDALEGVTVVKAMDTVLESIEGDNEALTIPINVVLCADQLSTVLQEMDSENADLYNSNNQAFMDDMFAFDREIRDAARNKNGLQIKGADGSMAYFAAEYGLENAPDAEDATVLCTYSFPAEEDLEVSYMDLMRRNLEVLIQAQPAPVEEAETAE